MDACTPNVKIWNSVSIFGLSCLVLALGAVMPPPWANPKLNPCARQPRGWQLLYWPEDGRCYKIFQKGYPCPEDKELSPMTTNGEKSALAECRCPPGAALHPDNNKCYNLYSRGPCPSRQYFAPTKSPNANGHRSGYCKRVPDCLNSNQVFWPSNGQCYTKLSRGPCPKGELIVLGSDSFGVCECRTDSELLDFYWTPGNSCFEHYTRGPCREHGHLFLPDRSCGCHRHLPHYHNETKKCYEIGTIGPCNQGQLFQMSVENAVCKCKGGHVYWHKDGNCYRPFTQGPCQSGQIIVNATSCAPIPCTQGYLYLPSADSCYRIGTQGPCPIGQVVIFDFRTRPSVDGVSYNGLCSSNGNLEKDDAVRCSDGSKKCYDLYTQGPCAKGQWLVPSKTATRCECKPGYAERRKRDSDTDRETLECISPTVTLANYLNRKYLMLYSQK